MTLASNTYMMYWNQHRSRLPEGYREVAYLEKSDSRYLIIDTGVLMEDRDYEWYAQLRGLSPAVVSSSTETGVAIGYNNRTLTSADLRCDIEKCFFSYKGVQYGATVISGNSLHSMSIDFSRKQLVVDGTSISLSGVTWYTLPSSRMENTTLFGYSPAADGANNWARAIIVGRVMIKHLGVPIRNFVPVVRTADNKPGMYDLCGSTCPLTGSSFYINSGTGADFTWGELQ